MGNLVSFFPARKAEKLSQTSKVPSSTLKSQESNASSNILPPALFKYHLEQERLPPEVDGYKNAIDLVIDLAAINRLSGEQERAIAAAETLSFLLFESMGDYFSEKEKIFYISEAYYDEFKTLLQKSSCLFSNFFLTHEKTKMAITALFALIREQQEWLCPDIPTSDHIFKIGII